MRIGIASIRKEIRLKIYIGGMRITRLMVKFECVEIPKYVSTNVLSNSEQKLGFVPV